MPPAAPGHSRTSSADLARAFRSEVGLVLGCSTPTVQWTDPLRVLLVTAHHNCLAVAYSHFVAIYRLKESSGFQLAFTTPYLEQPVCQVVHHSTHEINNSSTSNYPNQFINYYLTYQMINLSTKLN